MMMLMMMLTAMLMPMIAAMPCMYVSSAQDG
jgi:hypothetical protein